MKLTNIGKVLSVKDGIVIADGLSQAGSNELVNLISNSGEIIQGLVLNLDDEKVGIAVIGDHSKITEGDRVETTGNVYSVKVNDKVWGRVLDPLLNALDGRGALDFQNSLELPIQRIAAGVIERKDVDRPLQTGIKSVDTMIPIGRGQRQLIIGDRQTGKTAIAVDTIVNQIQSARELNLPLVKCVYVSVGDKTSKIAQLSAKLEKVGAMENTLIIFAGASDSPSLKYVAPYVGTTIAEYFAEKGEDVLVVFDDLTKHAWAYREISLLLRRPPGREAYPGDIFYLHSALLERGVQYSEAKGGGSITMLPIVETQAGDVSAYIPTNIISITDGQIYLEPGLFNAGIRPAVNVGLSVSRVGGSAQIKAMKQVAGQLRLDLAQYRELAAFAQFGSDLDEATKKKLDRGARMVELLKQNQYVPMSVYEQIALVFAGTKGLLDEVPVPDVKRWEEEFLSHFNLSGKKVIEMLKKGGKIEGDLEKELMGVITEFNEKVFA